MPPSLSVVIPVLNEQAQIGDCLRSLAPLRRAGVEIILVDGGSGDDTMVLAHPHVDRLISGSPGRALQMNAGAGQSNAEYLLFLHADTRLPEGFAPHWLAAAQWGFFPVRLSGKQGLFRVIERAMTWRSRLTGIGTGDQALFVRRELFEQRGGFPAIALMEDVALCRQLKRLVRPVVLGAPVLTSSRRWEQRGILKTVLQMWCLRLAYFVGVSPRALWQRYYPDTPQ
ncbi:TIGR04283 family arsenosugar biosynthesis glycosyltransferase [Porticoccus sp.]